MLITMQAALLLAVYAALFLGIPILIGVYVYRDAKAREMPAAMDTTTRSGVKAGFMARSTSSACWGFMARRIYRLSRQSSGMEE